MNSRSISHALAALALATTVTASANAAAETVTLDDFDVTYNGSSYDADLNQTTFYYNATGTSTGQDLSHITIGFPFCDIDVSVVTYDPQQAVSIGLDPTTGVYGIKWDLPLSVSGSQDYSFTLLGDYVEGEIEISVKAGRDPENGTITGPSCDVVPPTQSSEVSGSVWLDADADGVWDSSESAIANVTIALVDASGNLVATTVTGPDGSYTFTSLPEGDYHIYVPTSTDVDDINEALGTWFLSTTPSVLSLTVAGADIIGQDFGFDVDGGAVTDDLNGDDPDGDGFTFVGDGKTIGYWKHQNNVALKGKGRAQVDAVTLQSYLDQVEALHIAVPFEFADANEYAAALAVLESTSPAMVDLLSKQLLGTELNTVAGIGLSSYPALQSLLVAWGESLVADASSFTSAELEEAKDIFDAINNTGN